MSDMVGFSDIVSASVDNIPINVVTRLTRILRGMEGSATLLLFFWDNRPLGYFPKYSVSGSISEEGGVLRNRERERCCKKVTGEADATPPRVVQGRTDVGSTVACSEKVTTRSADLDSRVGKK